MGTCPVELGSVLLFASFNGPSDRTVLIAIIVSAFVSTALGVFLRRRIVSFFGGAIAAGLATFFIIKTDGGDMVGLVAMILTPIFALGGGVLGLIGAILGRYTLSHFRANRNTLTPHDQNMQKR